MITARQLEWAAGFIEGEGSVGYYRHTQGNGRLGGSFKIQATQVQKAPLERLQIMFGGSLVLVRRSLPRKHIWSWTLQGNPAAGVAMTLYGLMSPRRKEQIRAALDDWKAMPGRRGGYKWAA